MNHSGKTPTDANASFTNDNEQPDSIVGQKRKATVLGPEEAMAKRQKVQSENKAQKEVEKANKQVKRCDVFVVVVVFLLKD